MKASEKHANQKYAGMNTMTFTNNQCPHLNGWYATVTFWIFKKRVFVCSDCGDCRSV